MKSFLLSTAFTLIVSFAAAGCTTSNCDDEWPETTIAQSCTTGRRLPTLCGCYVRVVPILLQKSEIERW